MLQYLNEALERHHSVTEHVMEAGNSRDPIVFVHLVQGCRNQSAIVHGHHLDPEGPCGEDEGPGF